MRSPLLLAATLGISLPACIAAVDTGETEKHDSGRFVSPAEYHFPTSSQLAFPLHRMPTYDIGTDTADFAFCNGETYSDARGNPRHYGGGQRIDVMNASWLAAFSGNEYAHFGLVGPLLQELGFGAPADGDYVGDGNWWHTCGRDLHVLRSLECTWLDPAVFTRAEFVPYCPNLRTNEEGEIEPVGDYRGPPVDRLSLDELERLRHELPCVDDWLARRGRDVAALAPVTEFDPRDPASQSLSAQFQEWLLLNSGHTRRANGEQRARLVQFFSARVLGVDSEQTFSPASTQAVLAYHPRLNILVIGFRGTEVSVDGTGSDRAVDLDFRTVSDGEGDVWPGGVHRGFLNAFRGVEGQDTGVDGVILRAMLRIAREHATAEDPMRIFLTGHSLGAAIATIQTAYLLQYQEAPSRTGRVLPWRVEGLTTFGSPRVFTQQGAAKFGQLAARHGVTVLRFRNENDFVTRIPKFDTVASTAWNYLWGTEFDEFEYRHVGATVLLTGGYELAASVDESRLPQWGDPTVLFWDNHPDVLSHRMARYFDHLDGYRRRGDCQRPSGFVNLFQCNETRHAMHLDACP